MAADGPAVETVIPQVVEITEAVGEEAGRKETLTTWPIEDNNKMPLAGRNPPEIILF